MRHPLLSFLDCPNPTVSHLFLGMRLHPLARAAGPLLPLLVAIMVAGCAARHHAAYTPDPPLPPYRPAHGELVPPEVTGPASLPLAAYRIALDSVAARVREAAERGVTVFVDPAGLPPYVPPRELSRRGLRIVDREFRCGRDGLISFGRPRRFADGTYLIPIGERPGGHPESSDSTMEILGHVDTIEYAVREVDGAFVAAEKVWLSPSSDGMSVCRSRS